MSVVCATPTCAQFSRNAGCGYVLKPSWMLPGIPNVPEPSFPSLGERSGRTASGSPSGANPLPARAVSTLKVHLYSAFADQRGGCMCLRDDLFIQLELKGGLVQGFGVGHDVLAASNNGDAVVCSTMSLA